MDTIRIPHSKQAFEKIYAKVPPYQTAALAAFRTASPPHTLKVNGLEWEYQSLGTGQTILFLHGMAGAYDIWFQQFKILKEDFHLVAVTYPGAYSLSRLEIGLLAVLDELGLSHFSILGTSLGGYIAQYFVSRCPDKVDKAVFANTFPPNDLIVKQYGFIGKFLPLLPAWLIKWVMRWQYKSRIYPPSGYDELTLAYLNENLDRFTKADLIGRYHCLIEPFVPPDLSGGQIPVMVVQASNDPLLGLALRRAMESTYPLAEVVTVDNGHFPYLSQPAFYSEKIRRFLQS
ncbi:MAG: alpha/beta hydrolase [Anaerolineales bacterium]